MTKNKRFVSFIAALALVVTATFASATSTASATGNCFPGTLSQVELWPTLEGRGNHNADLSSRTKRIQRQQRQGRLNNRLHVLQPQ